MTDNYRPATLADFDEKSVRGYKILGWISLILGLLFIGAHLLGYVEESVLFSGLALILSAVFMVFLVCHKKEQWRQQVFAGCTFVRK